MDPEIWACVSQWAREVFVLLLDTQSHRVSSICRKQAAILKGNCKRKGRKTLWVCKPMKARPALDSPRRTCHRQTTEPTACQTLPDAWRWPSRTPPWQATRRNPWSFPTRDPLFQTLSRPARKTTWRNRNETDQLGQGKTLPVPLTPMATASESNTGLPASAGRVPQEIPYLQHFLVENSARMTWKWGAEHGQVWLFDRNVGFFILDL